MDIQKHLAGHFYHQRDKEYVIPDCVCADKHTALKTIYENLRTKGIEVRYAVFGFRWCDQPIPKEVLSVPHDEDEEHVCLEVRFKGSWYMVDATWDKSLSVANLPVNRWNGLTGDMANAVEITYKLTPEESEESMRDEPEDEPPQEDGSEEEDKNDAFYMAVNTWFGGVRQEYHQHKAERSKKRQIDIGELITL